MMQYITVQALGQARLADLHHQAQRDALARGTRRRRRGRRGGFNARRPELAAGQGTIRLRPDDAAGIFDGELRDLIRAALKPD